LIHDALAIGGDLANGRVEEISTYAKELRDEAANLACRTFGTMRAWFVAADLVPKLQGEERVHLNNSRVSSPGLSQYSP
jgi:hypothetical protein